MKYYINALLLFFLLNTPMKPEPTPSWSEWWTCNFGVVEDEYCYRTKQLKAKELETIFAAKKITINVNLRGTPKPEESWHKVWLEEQNTNKLHNVVGLDIALYEGSLPTPKQVTQMLSIIHNSKVIFANPTFFEENPHYYLTALMPSDISIPEMKLLVHCRRGADRTGLFSALYLIERTIDTIKTQDEHEREKNLKKLYKKATAELCLYHGHFSFVFPKMPEFIELWWNLRTRLSMSDALELYTQSHPAQLQEAK
jgi:hypothetical protein